MSRCGQEGANNYCLLPYGVTCPYHDLMRVDARGDFMLPMPRLNTHFLDLPLTQDVLDHESRLMSDRWIGSPLEQRLVHTESPPIVRRPPRVVEVPIGPSEPWPVHLMPSAGRAGHGRRKKNKKKYIN